jgi:spore coat polysaccharide biosynthesis predicted glycosyltransferase SpsG
LQHDIKKALLGFHGKYSLVEQNSNMANTMMWADLAITGDGLTKYETAVTGTPNITISHPRSDEAIHREFVKAGTTIFLGNGCLIENSELEGKIRDLLHDYQLRFTLSKNGKALVDGKGLERIIATIPHEVLR